ncbi:MAG: type II toxin-antitoxin system VapB family antitoxin [Pontiellaceae bacterium]|nr:type II toxin-antitoxin system VapB family antitoxin [Pontiellaceae bacterium]
MRTTLDLPETLVNEALKLSKGKTKTATITEALEDFVRKNRVQDLRNYKGAVDLDIDLDALRDRR